MKILYITPFVEGAGGVQRVLSTKTDYLIEKCNYEVSILATNSGTDATHYTFNEKINFYSEQALGNHFFYLYNYSKILKKYIHIIKPDIIVVCDNGYKGYAVPFLIPRRQKVIFECHGTRYTEENNTIFFDAILNRFKYKFFDVCAGQFSKVIVPVDDFRNEFKSNNLVVISNPIWFFTKEVPNYSSKKAIAVGRHCYQKNFQQMLSIWKKVLNKHPDWILEIYGESDAAIDLRLIASSSGISHNVVFYDVVRNINEKYLEASIFLLTSKFEGFGMVLIEAMASGLPCVSFDCLRGPKDIITNNKNGFLIENGNEQAFVEKLSLLMENEELRIKLGTKAQESIAIYDLDKIMKQWKNLFESLVTTI
jgi:glycosyltransferase involved in cell wall biosynthesis